LQITQNHGDLSKNVAFQLRLRQALVAAQESAKQAALLMIDFDRRENVDADDVNLFPAFLEMVGSRLSGALSHSDAVCRLTGGETAVLLPSLRNPEEASLVAKAILEKVEQPFLLSGLRVDVRPRIGIAMFPQHSTTAPGLMQCAETALIKARRTKQSFVMYSAEQNQAPRQALRLSELRQAIVRDQLFLLYQPKVNLKSGAIAGLEVLTRWQHPEHGLILPDEFIPLAERTGLIIPLALWVLHRSLVQCRKWSDLGIDLGVAVNLSMWNLEALELPEQIAGLLKGVGVAPRKLELEITESVIMDDPHRVMRTMKAIKDLGVTFTIDDFGTGYSSLAHLKKFPVTCIKIDKSFVRNMETDKDDAVIVRSLIELAHNLGLKVVAEGVETVEAKEMLKEYGCDEAQGYYFSRPVPTSDITRFFNASPTPPPRESYDDIQQISPSID